MINSKILSLFFSVGFAFGSEFSLMDVQKIGDEVTLNFQNQMKSHIQAFKSDQKAMALECVSNAEKTVEKFNQELEGGISLRRISQKNRNVKNVPKNNEEAKVLEAFELLSSVNVFLPNNIVKIDNDGNYTYYKPIVMNDSSCISCHGSASKIPPEVKKILVQHYPFDKAIDYQRGDFRGVFAIDISQKNYKKSK
jgi:hypothetical protein